MSGRGTRYAPEVRAAALDRLEAGESLTAVARDLGADRTTVAAWRAAAEPVVHVDCFVGSLYLSGTPAEVGRVLLALESADR